MRVIKFRGWNKQSKIMVDDIEVFAPRDTVSLNSCFDDNMVIQPLQYTGLKDKNGVEIYEGDILHVYEEVVDPWRNDNSKDYTENKTGFVEYLADETHLGGRYEVWYKDWKGEKRGYSEWIDAKHSEVIGNIYENPELLK